MSESTTNDNNTDQNNHKRICAKDVMRNRFIEVDGLSTVAEILLEMKKHNATAVIVKKRDEHDEPGLVLLSDIAKKVLAKDRAPERINAYEIMSKPVISVPPGMDIRYCARLFHNFGLAIAPVVDNGQVVGVVSYKELVFDGMLADA